MRNAFEAWAQRDGHIVRRREDKPEEYLVFETQRRWVIWQAALAHGKATAATKSSAKAKDGVAEPSKTVAQKPADETAVRNQVLNEVLDAFSDLDDNAGIEGVLKVIQGLKKKQKSLAEEKSAG
ncbi:MAG: hypothetical protein ABIT83_07095 [Massilia sp.]